ncbi:MAG: PIG-L family deacetylase [Steroidobacteraceae bacterium]
MKLACMLLFLVAAPWVAAQPAGPATGAYPPLQPIRPGDRLLVISPHPDDESLCCGGLIDEARRAGAQVAIVWVTSGDGFRWDAMVVQRRLRVRGQGLTALARTRMAEAEAAAGVLGVPRERQFFLGYPDRGILPLVLDYYYYDIAWRSRYTGNSAVVYPEALSPGSAYTGADLERDLNKVLDEVQPTLVLVPSPQDTHPDHRAVGILAYRLLSARGEAGRARFWIVHGGHGWPAPRAFRPDLPQTVAPRGRGMQWEVQALDDAALAVKRQAVDAHATQARVMGRVMRSHVRRTELYSRTPVPQGSPDCLTALPCEFELQPASEEAAF